MSSEVLRTPKKKARQSPRLATAIISLVGYAIVIGTFAGVVPFPSVSRGTVDLFSHVIAVVNTTALISLLLGYYWIRNREIRKHKIAMLTSFTLIIVFLLFYLTKVGGGGEKSLIAPDAVKTFVYLPMLGIHLLLSVVSVPVVVHAVVLGLTHPIDELPKTEHPKVGKIAVFAWVTSLILGILTYVMLNHVYSWEYTELVIGFV